MYNLRGLPVTAGNWYVAGTFKDEYEVEEKLTGGGVLEWCVDENDAKMMLKQMQDSGEFVSLNIGEYSHTDPKEW